MTGIALFAYHKYRKVIDSNVALDAHGNVIQLNGGTLSDQELLYDSDVELIASSYDTRPIHSSVSGLRNEIILG